MSKGQQAAMASGILSGLFMSPLMGAPECGAPITTLSECTAGMTTGQLAAIAEKYVRDHPEKWNVGVALLAVISLEGACPRFGSAAKDTGPSHASESVAAFFAAHCAPAPAPAAPK